MKSEVFSVMLLKVAENLCFDLGFLHLGLRSSRDWSYTSVLVKIPGFLFFNKCAFRFGFGEGKESSLFKVPFRRLFHIEEMGTKAGGKPIW